MSCDDILRSIEEVIDGEASPGARDLVAAHLLSCASCRSREAELRALDGAIVSARPGDPPATYWDELPARVLARIESEDASQAVSAPSGWLSSATLRYGAVAASVLVLIVAATFLGRGPGPGSTAGGSPTMARDESRDVGGEPARATPAVAEVVGDRCDELRSALSRTTSESTAVRDLRYELARCAVNVFHGEPNDRARAVAERELGAFLDIEPEGPRASELRDLARELER